MNPTAAAYAALELRPGASGAEVDAAYRRLIKQYHPDRAGGDPLKAAQITAAYGEICGERARDIIAFEEQPAAARTNRGWILVALILAALIFAAAFIAGPLAPKIIHGGPLADLHDKLQPKRAAPKPDADPMTRPLDLDAVDQAIADAIALSQSSDEMRMAAISRACHQSMHARPSLSLLDRCAAFDDAVVLLQDRDPMRDRGPFSQLDVTSRQWTDATMISSDYLAIDGRFDQIRLRAELTLAAPQPPAVAGHADNLASHVAEPSAL